LPEGQSGHSFEPIPNSAYAPAAHFAQTVEPSVEEFVPSPQNWQALAPLALLKVPGSHRVQLVLPSSSVDRSPAGHGTQLPSVNALE